MVDSATRGMMKNKIRKEHSMRDPAITENGEGRRIQQWDIHDSRIEEALKFPRESRGDRDIKGTISTLHESKGKDKISKRHMWIWIIMQQSGDRM